MVLSVFSTCLSSCSSFNRQNSHLSDFIDFDYLNNSLANLSSSGYISLSVNFNGSKLGAYTELLNSLSLTISENRTNPNSKVARNRQFGVISSHKTYPATMTSASNWSYRYSLYYKGRDLFRILYLHQGYLLFNINTKNIKLLATDGSVPISPELLYLLPMSKSQWYVLSVGQLTSIVDMIPTKLGIELRSPASKRYVQGQKIIKVTSPGINLIQLLTSSLIKATLPPTHGNTISITATTGLNGSIDIRTSTDLETISTRLEQSFNNAQIKILSLFLSNVDTLIAKFPPVEINATFTLVKRAENGKLRQKNDFYLSKMSQSLQSGLAGLKINSYLSYAPVHITRLNLVKPVPNGDLTLLHFFIGRILQNYF